MRKENGSACSIYPSTSSTKNHLQIIQLLNLKQKYIVKNYMMFIHVQFRNTKTSVRLVRMVSRARQILPTNQKHTSNSYQKKKINGTKTPKPKTIGILLHFDGWNSICKHLSWNSMPYPTHETLNCLQYLHCLQTFASQYTIKFEINTSEISISNVLTQSETKHRIYK